MSEFTIQVDKETSLKATAGQESAFQKFKQFLTSDNEKAFILSGYAGTGKTTLLKPFRKHAISEGFQVIQITPTGRAARILKKKTSAPTITIHSHIYRQQKISAPEKITASYFPKSKFALRKLNSGEDKDTVFLIDEASMIGKNNSNTQTTRSVDFGTGDLLQDIIEFQSQYRKGKVKLVFIGDRAQLPPIQSSDSPALSVEELKAYFIQAIESELTEVVRQVGNSPVLKLATQIREEIQEESYQWPNFGIESPKCKQVTLDALIHSIEATYQRYKDPSKAVLICYTNNDVIQYNNLIRKRILNRTQLLEEGEILIIQDNTKDIQGIPVYNGDIVKVKSFKTAFSITEKYRGKRYTIDFNEVTAHPIDNPEITLYLLVKTNNLGVTNKVDGNSAKALFHYLVKKEKDKQKDSKLSIQKKNAMIMERVFNSPEWRAVYVQYGYALTCHKAQGGEWPSVFINFHLKTSREEDSFRWGYTAITRATNEVWLMNSPIAIDSWIPKFWKIEQADYNSEANLRDPYQVQFKHPIHSTIHQWIIQFMDVETEEDLLSFTQDYAIEEYSLSEGKKLELLGVSGNKEFVRWVFKGENRTVSIEVLNIHTKPTFIIRSPLGRTDEALQRLCYRIFGVGEFYD